MKVCQVCKRIYVTESDYLRGTSRFRICSGGNLYFNCSCDGTLMLPQGKYGWYDPRKVMPERCWSLMTTYRALERVPAVPSVCAEVQEKLSLPDSSVDGIVSLLKTDPLFAGFVFALADVSRPKSSQSLRNLKEAVSIIGRKKLSEVMSLAAISTLRFGTTKYTLETHLRRAVVTGLVAEILYDHFHGEFDRDVLFLSGSLCEVGKIVSAVAFPKETDAVYEATLKLSPAETWSEAEKRLNSVSHIALGELACILWGLPEVVLEACTLHHVPILDARLLSSQKVPFSPAEIVVLACELAKRFLAESHLTTVEVFESCLQRFNTSEEKLMHLLEPHRETLMERAEQVVERVDAGSDLAS